MGTRKSVREVVSGLSKMQKVAGVIASIGAAAAVVYAGVSFARSSLIDQFGEWPYAERTLVNVLAGRTERDITSQQITRQVQIGILKSKCAIKCSDYERKALENLMREWGDEQRELEKLLKRR